MVKKVAKNKFDYCRNSRWLRGDRFSMVNNKCEYYEVCPVQNRTIRFTEKPCIWEREWENKICHTRYFYLLRGPSQSATHWTPHHLCKMSDAKNLVKHIFRANTKFVWNKKCFLGTRLSILKKVKLGGDDRGQKKKKSWDEEKLMHSQSRYTADVEKDGSVNIRTLSAEDLVK